MPLLVLLVGCLFCARPNARDQTREGSGPDDSADAVVLAGGRLVVFRFPDWSARIWTPSERRRWRGDSLHRPPWRPLLRPDWRFVPAGVVAGQSDNFLVTDRGNRRIWQLDSALQVLSSLPLPAAVASEDLDEIRLIHTAGHQFAFVHAARGLVYRYFESRGAFIERDRVHIPLRYAACRLATHAGLAGVRGEYPVLCWWAGGFDAWDAAFSRRRKLPRPAAFPPQAGPSPLPMVVRLEDASVALVYSLEGFRFCYYPARGWAGPCRAP